MLSPLQSAILVFAGASVLAAQPPLNDPAVGGIVLGTVLDSDSRLRPIFGVPGASTLGPPIAIDAGIQVIAIAPNYVLGVRGDARELVVVTPSGQRSLSTGITSAELSPRGSSAALLLDGTASAQVLSGLPNAPSVRWKPDLSALPGAPVSVAVNDEGTAVLAASPDADRVSIFLITEASGPRVVASAGKLAGMSFIPGTADALFGDAQSGQLQLLTGLLGSSALTTVADTVTPIDVASSDDGRQFFVASANPAGVIAIDRASGAQEAIACACNPVALVRLGRSGLFRLTDSSAGLFWMLDSAPPTRRIVAVPPDAPSTDGGAQ